MPEPTISRADVITLEIAQFSCETCGFPLEARRFPDGVWHWTPHYYCATPRVSLTVHQAKKLGRVSSEP